MKVERRMYSKHLCRDQAGSVVWSGVLHHGFLFGGFLSSLRFWRETHNPNTVRRENKLDLQNPVANNSKRGKKGRREGGERERLGAEKDS